MPQVQRVRDAAEVARQRIAQQQPARQRGPSDTTDDDEGGAGHRQDRSDAGEGRLGTEQDDRSDDEDEADDDRDGGRGTGEPRGDAQEPDGDECTGCQLPRSCQW